jgi:hypothetical protein
MKGLTEGLSTSHRRGWWAALSDERLLTATEAALMLRTSVAVICMWRKRGHLESAGEKAGRPGYRWRDLVDAETAVRLSRNEHPGTLRRPRPPWPGYGEAADRQHASTMVA